MTITNLSAKDRRARTKIIATLGPASNNLEMMQELLNAGADLFRLNMAHGSLAEHDKTVATIREASAALNRPVGILVDLGGPKIRLGQLVTDPLECRGGEEFRLIRGLTASGPKELVTTYDTLIDELDPGDRVMLADGTVGMSVVSRDADSALLRVIQAGTVRSRQGVNLPGVKLKTPAMTVEDEEHARWAARAEADFIGLSFVRSPADVQQLKAILHEHGSQARVIAKIEKPEALDHLEEIVKQADGVMVARGDLGVEIDVAQVPVWQKRIINVCRMHQKPVITATQMLDSMQNSPRPTRAEASDVANAIVDGTDACMLSGETAIGRFPQAAVETMNRIACVTEEELRDLRAASAPMIRVTGLQPTTEAVVSGASLMAARLPARLIVVVSRSGATALALSKQRNFVHTLGISDSPSVLRQMCLYWGVTPLTGRAGESADELIEEVQDWGRQHGVLGRGDYFILVAGTQASAWGHNQVTVQQLS